MGMPRVYLYMLFNIIYIMRSVVGWEALSWRPVVTLKIMQHASGISHGLHIDFRHSSIGCCIEGVRFVADALQSVWFRRGFAIYAENY